MASRSCTRNKIQTLLSSFLHDKENSIKARKTHDISENPGPLSMLCQPRNMESFYDRVETFSPYTWFMKPLYLSPQHCALYGWENTDVDLLTCVSCKATLDGTVATDWDSEMYNSICLKLKSDIVNGHSKFCPWRDSPCPESFLSLSAKSAPEWIQQFQSACKSLLTFEDNLPVLKREAFQGLELTEDILSMLSSYITECGKDSYHQDIVDTVCVLALCGWNAGDKDDSGTLCCSACRREAGLWNFHSLKSVSHIKNGSKDDDDGEEDIAAGKGGMQDPESVDKLPFERWNSEAHEGTQGQERQMEQEVQGGDVVIKDNEGIMETWERRENMLYEVVDSREKGDTPKEEVVRGEDICELGMARDHDNRQEQEMGNKDIICGDEVMGDSEGIQEGHSGTEETMACEHGIIGNVQENNTSNGRITHERVDSPTFEAGKGVEPDDVGVGGDHEDTQVLKEETEGPLPCIDAAVLATEDHSSRGAERQNVETMACDVMDTNEVSLTVSASANKRETVDHNEDRFEYSEEGKCEIAEDITTDPAVPSDPPYSNVVVEPCSPEFPLEIKNVAEEYSKVDIPLLEQKPLGEHNSGQGETLPAAQELDPVQDYPLGHETPSEQVTPVERISQPEQRPVEEHGCKAGQDYPIGHDLPSGQVTPAGRNLQWEENPVEEQESQPEQVPAIGQELYPVQDHQPGYDLPSGQITHGEQFSQPEQKPSLEEPLCGCDEEALSDAKESKSEKNSYENMSSDLQQTDSQNSGEVPSSQSLQSDSGVDEVSKVSEKNMELNEGMDDTSGLFVKKSQSDEGVDKTSGFPGKDMVARETVAETSGLSENHMSYECVDVASKVSEKDIQLSTAVDQPSVVSEKNMVYEGGDEASAFSEDSVQRSNEADEVTEPSEKNMICHVADKNSKFSKYIQLNEGMREASGFSEEYVEQSIDANEYSELSEKNALLGQNVGETAGFSGQFMEEESDANHLIPHEPRNPSVSIESSRLFGGAVFSPVHSRQDSLIVEVGEDSLSERLHSIQSELQDTFGSSSRMESRSLSECSDVEAEEPSLKKLKTEDVEKVEFDVLAEHRNWCPWVTLVPSLNPNNPAGVIQKYPGWKILLQVLIECSSPKKDEVPQTSSSQVWKSVRRLFHDCHSTILRGTGTKPQALERKV